MENMLEQEIPEEFKGYSPFFDKCVKLAHKLARKAGFIKKRKVLSDIEDIEKLSVISVLRSEEIRKKHKNSNYEYIDAMLSMCLCMRYDAAD